MKTLARARRVRPMCDVCGKNKVQLIDLYCRVSEDYDGDGGLRSVADQKDDGTDFVEQLGCCYRVGQVFMDPDLSGWQKKVIRPDFLKCMERVRNRETDGLWVYDVTRFTRKPKEGEILIDAADDGAVLYSNNAAKDLRRADDRKWFRDALTAAEHESMRLSERVTRGKRLKAKKRGRPNTSTRPFGIPGFKRPPPKAVRPIDYVPVDEDPEVVEAEREAIGHCAKMLLTGTSAANAIRWLNDQGFRTYYGNRWGAATFRVMMMRPSLAGYVTYGDEIVAGQDLPEPWAMDRETFDDLQAFMRSRPRGPVRYQGLLAGAMRCGRCGRYLGNARRSKARFPNYPEAQLRVYRCPGLMPEFSGTETQCGRLEMSAPIANEIVRAAMVERLGDERHRQYRQQVSAGQAERRQELTAQLNTAMDTKKKQAARLGSGAIDDDDYDAFIVQHGVRIAKIKAKLSKLDVPGTVYTTADEALAKWHAAVTADDIGTQKAMIRESFPWLTAKPALVRGRNAAQPERIDWDGVTLPAGVKKDVG